MFCSKVTIFRIGFSDSFRLTAPTELKQMEESKSDNDNETI